MTTLFTLIMLIVALVWVAVLAFYIGAFYGINRTTKHFSVINKVLKDELENRNKKNSVEFFSQRQSRYNDAPEPSTGSSVKEGEYIEFETV